MIIHKSAVVLISLAACLGQAASALAAAMPDKLRTGYRIDPPGIDEM